MNAIKPMRRISAAPVQPSQPFAANTKNFTTHLLANSDASSTDDGEQGRAEVWDADPPASLAATAPTLDDLGVLYGGRDRLLRVTEVAKHLGVCAATVRNSVHRERENRFIV